MTFAHAFTDWQRWPDPRSPHHSCAPNLQILRHELIFRFGLVPQGCYGRRAIRGGVLPSSHSYGAALDMGYPAAEDARINRDVIPWLIAWSEELGVQAVHDYRRSRIWRAGRTEMDSDACDKWWKAQRPSKATGMGQEWCNHLHIETPETRWADNRALLQRHPGLIEG